MGAGQAYPSYQTGDVDIVFKQLIFGDSKWSYELGSPVPPPLVPYLQPKKWEELLTDIYAATRHINQVGVAIIATFTASFVILSMNNLYAMIVGFSLISFTIIYTFRQQNKFRAGLRAIQLKFQPDFQPFGTIEYVQVDNNRVHRTHSRGGRSIIRITLNGDISAVVATVAAHPQQPQMISVTVSEGVQQPTVNCMMVNATMA